MKVVQPYVAKDWKSLLAVSRAWVNTQPDSAESWFYLAAAEFETADYEQAQKHFEQALSLNSGHSEAREYLSKLAVRTARSGAPEHIAYLGD
jgi:cytochrome c-type biogenesis protein CcmH/NrfG